MLFPDISCTVSESLKRNEDYGVYKLVGADYVEVMTVYKQDGAIQSNGVIQHGDVDLDVVEHFKREHVPAFLDHHIYRNEQYDGHYFYMTSNKEAKPFIAFTLLCRRTSPFNEKDAKWIDIYTDLDNRRILLENDMHQERNYLESVITCSSAAILVLNAKYKVLSANPLAQSILDFESETRLRFSDPEQRLTFYQIVDEVIETGCRRHIRRRLLPHKDGDRVFSTVVSPLPDSKNRIAGVVVVSADITESQILSSEIEQLKQYGMLGELSLGLAHDIKNPLTSIQGCAQLLRRPASSGRQRELSNIIQHEVSRINDVVEQILAFGSVSSQEQAGSVDLNAVLGHCAQIIERQKLHKAVSIQFDLAAALPPIRAKELRVQQVFLNLMLNALQSIDRQGTIWIRSADDGGGFLRVQIEDDGVGIPEQELPKLFNPYYTTKKHGTGMGLPIVKRTVEKYGGEISITSRHGVGTCCMVRLPTFDREG